MDYLQAYLSHIRSKELLPNTLAMYDRKIRHFISYMEERSGQPYRQHNPLLTNASAMSEYYQLLSRSQSIITRNHSVTIIRQFLAFIMRQGDMTTAQLENMISLLPYIKPKKNRIRVEDMEGTDKYDAIPLDKKELVFSDAGIIEALMACERGYQHDRNRAIIALFLSSGLRSEELCSLNVRDFQNMRQGKILCLRKGGEPCWVDVADMAIPHITSYLKGRKHLDEKEPLFITKISTRMTPRNLYSVLQTRFQAIGINAAPHDFRRAFLTAVEQSGSAAIAMSLANHKKLSTTSTYTIPTEDDKREAINNLPWTEVISHRYG